MPLIHNLYIGHFIPEQGYVRFEGHQPAITRSIDQAKAEGLLKHYAGGFTQDELPEAWGTSILPEYILCNQLSCPPEALLFAADYAEQEGAIILDIGSFSLLKPEQLRHAAVGLSLTQPARAIS